MNKIIGVVIVFNICLGYSFWNPSRSHNKEGNEHYRDKNYQQALVSYLKAQKEEPENPYLDYNIANVYYQQQHYTNALAHYEKALYNGDIPLQAQTYYNQGNCHFKLQQYDKAVLAYKKALELNDKDLEAKHNLELARKKLREHSRKQKNTNKTEPKTSSLAIRTNRDLPSKTGLRGLILLPAIRSNSRPIKINKGQGRILPRGIRSLQPQKSLRLRKRLLLIKTSKKRAARLPSQLEKFLRRMRKKSFKVSRASKSRMCTSFSLSNLLWVGLFLRSGERVIF